MSLILPGYFLLLTLFTIKFVFNARPANKIHNGKLIFQSVHLVLIFLLFSKSSFSQVITLSNPEIIPVKFEGLSPALRDVPGKLPTQDELNGIRTEHGNSSLEHRMTIVNHNALPKGADPAVQKSYSSHNSTERGFGPSVTILDNWNGLTTSTDPSDNTIAVGPNHVMQMTNNSTSTSIRIWDKTGTVLVNNKLVSSISGINNDYGDPNVIYDEGADRFVFLVLYSFSAKKLIVCVSQTPDPAGAYYVYSFTTANGYPDYPKIAVWDNSYFITTNSDDPMIFALDRSAMLAGSGTGVAQAFTLTAFPTITFQSASPITQTGSIPPPPGSPATIIRVGDDAWGLLRPDHLQLFHLNIDWVTPANSTITGPVYLNTIPYNSNLCGYLGDPCIPQPGTSTVLDPLSDIVMDKVQYRNMGSYEAIVCSHVCNATGNGTAGVRWYELRKDSVTNWHIYQQSTYSPPGGTSRFMSSITMNGDGEIALGYNISSGSIYPGIAITGRDSCDSLNLMTIPETIVKNGTAANGYERYGDYNAMVTDPVDGSFWFTANYNPSSVWATHIVHFEFSNCDTISTAVNEAPGKSFDVRPNPTKDLLTVYGLEFLQEKNSKYFFLDIYNAVGEKVLSQKLNVTKNKTEATLDISRFSNGVYLVVLNTGENSYRKKIVKD